MSQSQRIHRPSVTLAKFNGTSRYPSRVATSLYGVLQDPSRKQQDSEAVWPLIKEATDQAIQHLPKCAALSSAMAEDLLQNVDLIERNLTVLSCEPRSWSSSIRIDSPRNFKNYSRSLVGLESSDVVREVGIFADRCDISEETVRLKSHLEQFRSITRGADSNGRKLDFVTQEMFRETNTIGSKANDSEIAHFVVEIKTAIEQFEKWFRMSSNHRL